MAYTDFMEKHIVLAPALLILFGTTGDLAAKKLFPALRSLHDGGDLPEKAAILGIGRRPWDDASYRARIAEAIAETSDEATAPDPAFLERFYYHRMDMRDTNAYDELRSRADALARARDLGDNRIYFLATAPDLFPVIAEHTGRTGQVGNGGFRRLMVEKPFGRDLASAQAFNEGLYRRFTENEIYRIDHYLGKEMLQNILVLRFANRLFEPVWNTEHIDHIQISVRESGGVDQRGGYYDHAGALRDMVQNHLLQLLALLAMEKPACFETECVRDEKVKVLRGLRLFHPDEKDPGIILGQYAAAGEQPGYREEKGVEPDSATETFAALRLEVDNPRWRGVPFYLKSGKALDRSAADIAVVFKPVPYGGNEPFEQPNVLLLRVQPQEGVNLQFNIKQPGTVSTVTQVDMDFCQTCRFPGQSPDAYVRLLRDAWVGDLNLFTRWDEIEAAWTLVDCIQAQRENVGIEPYARGSAGPDAASRLLTQEGRSWIEPEEKIPGTCEPCHT